MSRKRDRLRIRMLKWCRKNKVGMGFYSKYYLISFYYRLNKDFDWIRFEKFVNYFPHALLIGNALKSRDFFTDLIGIKSTSYLDICDTGLFKYPVKYIKYPKEVNDEQTKPNQS